MRSPFRIALWAILALIFLAFYNVASRSPGSQMPATDTFINYLPLLFLGLFGFFFWRNLGKARVVNDRSVGAQALISQGRFTAAHAIYTEIAAAQEKRSSFNRGLVYFNIGYTRLCVWRLTEAEAAFRKAMEKPTSRLQVVDSSRLVRPWLALTLAVRGDGALARKEIADGAASDLGQLPAALLAGVVLEAREGHWEAVRAGLRQNEIKQLGGPPRGLAEALGAWSVEQLTGERRPVDQVALFGEAGPDAFAEAWPAFDAFLKRAQLE